MDMVRIPTDSQAVIDVYHRAADENRNDYLLRGATLYLPDYGQVVMTGDYNARSGKLLPQTWAKPAARW